MWAWLAACADPEAPPRDAPPPTPGEGPFAEGCPPPGGALARVIGVDDPLPGAVAVGRRGDLLLANERAAFVITQPFDGPQTEQGTTYAYYGGVVADAVAMDGCAVASEDGLDEVHLVLGTLDLANFERSVLRSFRGERATVLRDGSDGGAAVVRVEGTDATHWLVEGELLNAALGSGRTASAPFGLEVVIDYVLEPDSPVLRTEWTLRNPGARELTLLTASLLSFDPRYDVAAAGAVDLSFGGFGLTADVPALTATSGDGAVAFGVEGGRLAYTGIAGIDVSLDLDQALTRPLVLAPGGGEDGRVTRLSVGAGSGPSATEPLLALDGEPGVLQGTVRGPDGPVADAWVDVWGDGGAGPRVFDRVRTSVTGAWRAVVPEGAWSWSVSARAAGRDGQDRVAMDPGDTLHLEVGLPGTVWIEVDADGGPIPARLELERDDGLRATLFTPGRSEAPLPPGRWEWTATHGYTHAPRSGVAVVLPGGVGLLGATLVREVDPGPWSSIDTHVHSAESPDSRMDPVEQVLHAAAHGLDVVLHTEHEHVVDVTTYADDAGVTPFVRSLGGQEVTATIPEHLTMLAVVPDGSPRGGFVDWYGKDLDQVFAAMKARSGGVNILNHPGYMDRIGWDVVTAMPTLEHPEWLGLPPDAALWSWNLEGIEVMNGTRSPFADGNHRFELWQSLLNAGHHVAPIGCSDDHGGLETGFPRTMFLGDDPVEAIREGRVTLSAGALLDVEVEGVGPGGTALARAGLVDLRVVVRAPAAIDVSHVVVFEDCDQVASVAATDRGGPLKLDVVVPVAVDADTQLTVAAFGEGELPAGLLPVGPTTPRALSGAIWIDADGDGDTDPPGGRVCRYDLLPP